MANFPLYCNTAFERTKQFLPYEFLVLAKLSQFLFHIRYLPLNVLDFLFSALQLNIVFKFTRPNLKMPESKLSLTFINNLQQWSLQERTRSFKRF